MIVVCPKCDVALILLEFNGVELDFCDRCEGLWLDNGEIEQIVERTGGRAAQPFLGFVEAGEQEEIDIKTYLCPRCDQALKEIVRPDADGEPLRIDRCPVGDGVWFDKGELQHLLRMLPAETDALAAAELLSNVLGCDNNDSSIKARKENL